MFEQQAARTPEAIAVVFDGKSVSYLDLNIKANQLARYLRANGVGPEVLVGICVDRSVEMIIGLLAILKTGGAYVPMDPTYPQDRLEFMMSEISAPLVLTQAHLLEKLGFCASKLLFLDSEWTKIADQAISNPAISISLRV